MPSTGAGPDSTDVIVAIFGASAGLGGLVLVFFGIVIAGYQGLPADAPRATRQRVKWASIRVLVVFAMSFIVVGLSLAWLTSSNSDVLYRAAVGVFIAQLAGIFGLATWTTFTIRS